MTLVSRPAKASRAGRRSNPPADWRTATSTGQVRIAIYTRISTDEEHQPFSLEAQDHRLDAYIRSQDGWVLTHKFSDQMTGSTLERPDLQRALAAARASFFDLLLVYRVDRIARSVRGLAQILEELYQAHVLFRSATEPFDTGTPAGRMMVQMLGVFAEFERATLIDRVINGMERKVARGGWMGGSAPYGYRLNQETRILEPDPERAHAIQTIFDLYVRERMGTRSVANWLTGNGYRSPTSKPWSHRSVQTIIENRVYLGELNFRGTSHKGPHQPLVDTETFDAANRLLDERGETRAKCLSNSTDYLLSGLCFCGVCDNRFLGNAAHGRNGAYTYYTCYLRHRYGAAHCQPLGSGPPPPT